MQRIVWCAYLNAYLPVSAHREVTTSTEASLAIRLQIEAIGAHRHVEHCRVERHTNRGFSCASARENMHRESVGSQPIRTHFQLDCELLIAGSHSCAEGGHWSAWMGRQPSALFSPPLLLFTGPLVVGLKENERGNRWSISKRATG